MTTQCPICRRSDANVQADPLSRDAIVVDCRHCGSFGLTRSLVACLGDFLNRNLDGQAKLSHALRRAQSSTARPLFSSDQLEVISRAELPRPREQLDLLIRWIAEHVGGPGEPISISYEGQGAVIGSKSSAGFELVAEELRNGGFAQGLPRKYMDGTYSATVTPTFMGWDHYEQIRGGHRSYGKAFMAMKFGDQELHQMLEASFKPSAARAGFKLLKLDDVPVAGLIDNRLRAEIQSADFVIADLSHDNLGAYWEAGYAEGLGKPVIYTCKRSKFESTRTHFDTNHHLTILWEPSLPAQCSEQLVATIRATLPTVARMDD